MKWFKHDSDAGNDPKIKKLKKKFGMSGYGVYFNLLEIIARKMEDRIEEFGFVPKDWDDESLELEFGLDTDTLRTMFDYMVEIGLFELKDKRMYNAKIQSRCDDYTSRILRRDNYNALDKRKVLESPNTVRTKSDKVPLRIEENRIEENTLSQENGERLLDPSTGKKPRTARGYTNAYRMAKGKEPLSKKPMTKKQVTALENLNQIDDVIKKHRTMAEKETGTDYSFMDEDKNPQIRRLIALTIPKVEKHGKTMDDYIIFIKENSFAREKQYNPLLCYTEAMIVHFLIGKNKRGGIIKV